jgi:ABC-type sugar transport system permease subunit
MWLWVFKSNGVANWVLQSVGLHPVRWLGERWLAVPVLGFILSAAVLGSIVVVLMVALEGVPRELREAARMDGAGMIRTWLNVDIPCISKMIGYMAFSAMVSGFGVWEIPYVMTRGGPEGATASVMYEIWDQAFVRQHYGVSAAQSVLLLVLVTAITLTAKRVARNGT